MIGKDIDRRECEIYKIAQQYKVDVKMQDINLPVQSDQKQENASVGDAAAPTNTQQAKSEKSGMVTRWEGDAHFDTGSSTLTPKAREYFSAVAEKYKAENQVEQIVQEQAAAPRDPNQVVPAPLSDADKAKMAQQLNLVQIVLVGNTDDTGDSLLNAKLSEKRAKAVAELFKSKGVPADRLYYLGAGETDPVADNREEAGRARNRRVDIIEMATQEKLVQYLKLKRSNLAYYRPRQTDVDETQTAVTIPADTQVASTEVADAQLVSAPGSQKKHARVQKSKIAENVSQGGQADSVMPDASAISRDSKTSSKKAGNGNNVAQGSVIQQAAIRNVSIDFGGKPASEDKSFDVVSSFGELVAKKPTVLSQFSSIFVKEAQANTDTVYAVNCLKDSPRVSGDVMSLKSGKKLDYKTRDYLPGLYETSWTDAVNGNLVALTHVGVLRDDAKAPNNPELFVYPKSGDQVVCTVNCKGDSGGESQLNPVTSVVMCSHT